MRKPHSYLPSTLTAAAILGAEITRGRLERRLTQPELAGRAGISLSTLRNVERGAPTVAIGIVFELAHLVGIDLLADPSALPSLQSRVTDRLQLLPSRVRPRGPVDDKF